MTQAQEKAIARLRRLVDRDCKDLREEVKTFEVEEYDHFVSVYVVLGYEHDEGTFAALARDYAHLFIGKRGGVRFPLVGRMVSIVCRSSGIRFCKLFADSVTIIFHERKVSNHVE